MSRRLALDRTLRIAACLGAILAAGCGGGGGGGEVAPPELLQITTQSQVAVARATAAMFASLGGVSDLPIGSPTAAARATAAIGYTRHALGTVLQTTRAASGAPGPLAITSMTEPCDFGGSVTVSVDDRDSNGQLSAGDVLTMAFNQCRVTDSSTASGSLGIAISSISATQLAGLFTFNQLTAIDDGYMSIVNGQMNGLYSEATDPSGTRLVRTEMTVTGSELRVAGSTPGYSDTFTHYPGFRAVWKDFVPLAPAAAYSTSEMNGQVHVASLAGRIVMTTDASAPMHDWWDQPYPDSGKVTVDGYRSHLRMTVMNTVTVRLELDANDDGTFESTQNVPWTQLLP